MDSRFRHMTKFGQGRINNPNKEPTGVEDDLPDAHLFQIEAVPAELEEID